MHFLQSHVLGPGAIVDVGANMGAVSITLARRFPDRRLLSIEANPTTCAQLRRSAEANGCINIGVRDVAVADRIGEIWFATDTGSSATCHISEGGAAGNLRVKCTTLSGLVEEEAIDRVALLKVDVEGYELPVFRGAADLIRDGLVSVVYFEVCPAVAVAAGFDPAAAAEFLAERGFSLFRIQQNGGLVPTDPSAASAVELENWVAVFNRPASR
jgi:FkbM family methyltransferase